jgi:MFS family permease
MASTAADPSGAKGQTDDSTSAEDRDDQRERYRELLEELRTIMPGAQVLLAFLLTVPFASGFADVDRLGKAVFTVSLGCAATSTVLFLAPAAYHRVAGRGDHRRRLAFGVTTTLVGLALLALAVAAAVFVVVRFLYETWLGALLGGLLAAAAAALWLVVPLLDRQVRTDGDRRPRH